MTVVTTLMSSTCTVHASDSLLTTLTPGGETSNSSSGCDERSSREVFPGAIAYYGLAGRQNGWQTLAWLRTQASEAGRHGSVQEVGSTGHSLQANSFGSAWPAALGIGLHFSAYERVTTTGFPNFSYLKLA